MEPGIYVVIVLHHEKNVMVAGIKYETWPFASSNLRLKQILDPYWQFAYSNTSSVING
jgi:endonuclease/exonuclease/phosphatase (EEP) superfamily protein YafD